MRMRFAYRNYPGYPELTAKRKRVAVLTHPVYGIILGALPGILAAILFPSAIAVPIIVLLVGAVAGPILLKRYRNREFARIELEYVRHLHGKMLRTPAQPAAGLQRADTAPVWKPDPPPEDRPLERDLQLGFNSISTPNGHYGSQITYIHLQRVVEEKIWGDKTEIKTISVPEEIQTMSGLAQYLRQKAPALMTHIRACGGEWFTRY